MPTKEEQFLSKLQQFNEKYGVQVSLDGIDTGDKNPSGAVTQDKYRELVSSAVVAYLSNAIPMKEGASYDFTSFSIPKFAEDFEDVMQARSDAKSIANRQPYEGIKLDELFDEMAEAVRPYSYPLSTLWVDCVLRGDMNPKSMRAITDRAHDMLTKGWKSPDNMDEEATNALTCVIAAKETMEAIREKRGFFWKLFHPIQNSREKSYIKELTKQTVELEGWGYPVNDTAQTLQNEILTDTYDNLYTHDAYDYRYEVERQEAAKLVEELAAKGIVYDSAVKLESKINNKHFEADLTDELLNVLPEGGATKEEKKVALQGKVKSLVEKAQEMNKEYDKHILFSDRPKTAMEIHAMKVFLHAFQMTEGLRYNLKGRFLAAQKMTDVVMKQISPVAIAQEALGQYAQGYVLANDIDSALSFLEFSMTEPRAEIKLALEDARNSYGIMQNDRERIQFAPEEFSEPVNAVSDKVEEKKDESFIVDENFWNTDPFRA